MDVRASAANAPFVLLTDDQAAEMLRDARTAGLVKLHCGKGFTGERQEWAGRVVVFLSTKLRQPIKMSHLTTEA